MTHDTWYRAHGTCQCDRFVCLTLYYWEQDTIQIVEGKDGRKIHFQNKDVDINVYLYINICIYKWCKFILKLLRHVSVLIHHLQGV